MPRQPKLSLATIVAEAAPTKGRATKRAPARSGPAGIVAPAASRAAPRGAEIVPLDRAGPSLPEPRAGTLKQRARQMSVYLEPPVYDQLRDLAYSERAKMHGLMLEALDLLFRQRGARSIAQILDTPER